MAAYLLCLVIGATNSTDALASPARQKDPPASEAENAELPTDKNKTTGKTENGPELVDAAHKKKWAHSSVTFVVSAPQDVVWDTLVDFEHYPNIFKRIETCKVTKHENDIVYTESYLKPQMFVSKRCNHTWINLAQKPHSLNWKLLDGNFKGAEGNWDFQNLDKNKTQVTYTLFADPGPIIPATLVSWLLHSVVKDVVDSVRTTCSENYKAKIEKQMK